MSDKQNPMTFIVIITLLRDGETATQRALYEGRDKIVYMLLKGGGDGNIMNK